MSVYKLLVYCKHGHVWLKHNQHPLQTEAPTIEKAIQQFYSQAQEQGLTITRAAPVEGTRLVACMLVSCINDTGYLYPTAVFLASLSPDELKPLKRFIDGPSINPRKLVQVMRPYWSAEYADGYITALYSETADEIEHTSQYYQGIQKGLRVAESRGTWGCSHLHKES